MLQNEICQITLLASWKMAHAVELTFHKVIINTIYKAVFLN